jgi:hypothetical protein
MSSLRADPEGEREVAQPLVTDPALAHDEELIESRVRDGQASATSASESWGDSIPLGPPDPDPLPLDGLPSWILDHVRSVADHQQVPSDLPLQMALASVSTAIAGKAEIELRPGWREPLNLWTLTVLPPANRKSAATDQMNRPIYDYEAEHARAISPDRTTALNVQDTLEKKLEKAKRDVANAKTSEAEADARQRIKDTQARFDDLLVPTIPRLLASDVTPERLLGLMAENDGRMAVLAPEGDLFRIMAGRYSKGGRDVRFDVFKRAWTGEPIRDDRIGREGSYVRRPALTLGIAVQPRLLENLENRSAFRGEGLLGRFLYAVPESRIGHRLTGRDVPPLVYAARTNYARTLRTLLEAGAAGRDDDGDLLPHLLELSESALDVLDDFEADVERKLRPGGELGSIPDWGGKLVGSMCRIAGVLHVAQAVEDGNDPWRTPVAGLTMASAMDLGYAYIGHARAVLDSLDLDPELALARYVWNRIRTADDPGLTERDVFDLCRGKPEIERMEDLRPVLAVLEYEHNLIRLAPRKSRGGRPPSPFVKVNPAVDVSKRRRSPSSSAREHTSTTSADVPVDLRDDLNAALAGGDG